MTKNNKQKETLSPNEFHASGGAISSDTEQVTASFALVLTFAKPRPTAKTSGVSSNAGATVQRDNETEN